MDEEIMERLQKNFPVLKKLEKSMSVVINDKGKLCLKAKYLMKLTQQDCLELSQLFALLATAFEEVKKDDSERTNWKIASIKT